MKTETFATIIMVVVALTSAWGGYRVGKANGKLEERNYQASLEQKVNAEMKAAGFCKWAEEGCK